MSGMQNPDLLAPGDTLGLKQGALPAITQPLPEVQVEETKVYFCPVPNASFHRTDSKRLPFINGFHKTDNDEDIKFLDAEIKNRNPYLRLATEQEIAQLKMATNPVETIRESVRAELETSLRAELEVKIRNELVNGSNTTDEKKIEEVDATQVLLNKLKDGIKTTGATVVLGGISGTDKLEAVAAGSSSSTAQ